MKRAALVFWMGGVTLLVALLLREGLADVGRAVGAAGWGLLAVSAFYPVVLAADTRCWQLLLPRRSRPSLARLIWASWICDAVNQLLPVAQVGGDIVRMRLVALHGVPGPVAGASVVADVTVGVATQIIFSIPGVFILMQNGRGGATGPLVALGLLLFGLLVAGFLAVQHWGLFQRLTRLLERIVPVGDWKAVIGGAEALDQALVETYRRPRTVMAAAVWRLAGWVLGTGEVWLALHFLGHPVGLPEAFMLESLGQAVRNGAFVVPGALGVQEAAFILLGSFAGLGPETGLALSLVKRVRELALGLPALLAWHLAEGHRLLHARVR